MINDHITDTRPSFTEAIKEVQATGRAEFLLVSGQVTKLNRKKLLQNYEAILHMAGIEQVLGESIGLTPGSEELKIADAKLSRFADVPAYWVLPLGQLINRADRQKSIPSEILKQVALLKTSRDAVMHGNADAFGVQTRKAIRQTYDQLLKHSRYTPSTELRSRFEAVTKAKIDGTGVDEMLATLGTLYRAIECEAGIRTAMSEAGVLKGEMPAVESIFELMRASDRHKAIFKRDDLTWKFRASALVRNHLVHGSIIVPTKRQTDVVDQAYELLGQAIAEIRFRKNGGKSSEGDFRNGLNL